MRVRLGKGIALLVALAAVLVLLAARCGSRRIEASETRQPTARARLALPGFPPTVGHVFLLVFENRGYSEIIDSSDAPYLNELARRYELATNYYAVTHPSLPNYLALTGGSTFGIKSNCAECNIPGSSLADEIEAEGLTWRAYFESLPHPCYTGARAGLYVKKHNPFIYYDAIRNDRARCRENIVPLTELRNDLASGSLPNFALLIPNLCHDMHDCDVRAGDAWLERFLPTILESHAYQEGGVLFLTFEEDGGNDGNRVATLVISPYARVAARLTAPYDHYTLLRTIEDLLGLSHLRSTPPETPA